jgi:diguanylate cyclase (GGDEF)-like protein
MPLSMSNLSPVDESGECRPVSPADAVGSAARPELLKWFTIILIVVTCLFLGVFLYPLQNWRGAAVLAVLGIGGLLTPPLYRWSESLTTATHYFAAICFTTIVSITTFTGGLYAPGIAWLVVVPLVATMLSGPRLGAIWLGVVAAEVILISLIAPSQFVLTQTLSPDDYQFLSGLSLLGLAGCVFAALLVDHMTISAAQQRLQYYATRDGLTGLLNHRVLMDLLQQETEAARDRNAAVALIMIDVDYFKSVNDRYGHVAGDEALQETARRITRCLRPEDHVGRYGGEEFLCILPDCPLPTARHLAELTRQAVAGRELVVGERSISMSVSVGVAVCDCEQDPDGSDALRRADRALYTAKRCGRNRTCVDASTTSRSPLYKCELPVPARTMMVPEVE